MTALHLDASPAVEEYDLVIIGTGSGNSLIGPEMDGWRIAIVERGVFGGTCLNHGCIPTKMLVYPADVIAAAEESRRLGLVPSGIAVDWPVVRDRIFGRIDPIAAGGRDYRISLPHVDVYEGSARFVGTRTIEVLGRQITGRQVVIAAGARPFVPDIPGLGDVPFHTSDTIMRVDALPRRLVVLGGGYIAAEFAHVFHSFGVDVVVVNRSGRLLMGEDDDVSRRFTDVVSKKWRLLLGADVLRVRSAEGGVALDVSVDGEQQVVEGDALLVAAGRVPNGDELCANDGGIEVDERGAVVVDRHGRTSCPGVWALGDVNGRHQLKHMANGEAKVVRHNLSHPHDLRSLDERAAPHGVFSHPQVAAVGLTEREAVERRARTGDPFVAITHDYAGAAYGWAMEDTTSFCKLVGDPRTRTLLGAHVIGPQASMLLQLLVQGMHLGTTVDDMALGQIWTHPALTEVVEQALLAMIDAFDVSDAGR